MGFFKKKQPSATTTTAGAAAADPGPGTPAGTDLDISSSTALAVNESDPPKKAPLSQRLHAKRTDLTSASATSRLAHRDSLAARQANVSYVTGHAGTQLAIWGARTGGDVARRAAVAAGSGASALGPMAQTLSALAMFGAVAPLLTAYGDVLDLANEIERKIVNFVVLADTAYDMFKSRITRDAMTERQIVEVKVILEKMEATTGQAMEVLTKVQDMGMIKVTMQVATLKNEFAPIRVKVTNLLKTLHARITTIQLALFDAQANQAQVLRDGLAATAEVVRGWMTTGERDVIAAIRKSDEGHKQVAHGLRELLREIEELGVPPGVYKEVKNKEVLALWQYLVGNAGPVVEAGEFVEVCAGLGVHLYASDEDSESAEILFAWTLPIVQTGVLVPMELGLFDEHVDPSGQYVSLLKLDQVCEQKDEDVLEPVNVPTLLLWRVYAWTSFSQSLLESFARLAPSLSLASAPLLTPLTSQLSTVLTSLRAAWQVTPAIAHRIDQLAPLLSFTRAGAQLAPSTQSLIDALTALVQLTSAMAGVAADAAWLMDPECDAAKEYTVDFPARVAHAWNTVAAAARAMGLESADDMPAAQVAHIQHVLAQALDVQQSAMAQLVDLTAPAASPPGAYLESIFGALVSDWSLLTADIDTTKRVQPVSSTESLLLLTDAEAARVLPQLARVLASVCASPNVTRVTGLLVPQPDVYPLWGVLVSTPAASPVCSLHAVLSTGQLTLAARIKLARDITAGVYAVLAARDPWDDSIEPLPLEVSPHSVMVAVDAMGAWAAYVPPCAGVVPVAVRGWDAGCVAATGGAAARDVYALGKVIGEMLSGMDEGKGGKEVADLVARMCHADAGECIKVTLAEVQSKLDVVASQADLDVILVEELAIVPTPTTPTAPASSLPTSPQPAASQPQPPPPTLPPYPSLSLADAQSNFHTARNRIRNCTGRPLSDPDYDATDTVTLLLSAGMPGHVPMALVLAADMWYYGVIQPRVQPTCWETARYLYARAATMGCKYANVGLGDLMYFGLGKAEQGEGERVQRAEEYYKLALEHVDNPTLNLDLTEHQQARVYCGLGDVLSQRASLTAAADPALAHRLYVQALGYLNRAYHVDPRCKRALARKAMFKIQQVGGEAWDRTMVLAWKQAARSRENPVPELMVRLALYEMDGDVRGADAVRRMVSVAEVPEH